MNHYKAPTRDILFASTHLAGLNEIAQLPGHDDITEDLLQAILEEAGKIGEEVLAPLNRKGDIDGAKWLNGNVQTVDGWKAAYKQFIEGGWNGLAFDVNRGGQGLPWLASIAIQEIWHASNMAFSLCPLLTQGAIEAINLHGSTEQKDTYLAPLISGVWSGTMNLTEPQAGSDLTTIKTTATPSAEHYLLKGQKIFITYGDHDLTDNIIHLVLARTPHASLGTKGVSLFIVPKYLQDENGDWNVKNDIDTLSIEHKLGIHGSPTTVLSYGSKNGAIGYRVGEENQGMAYMFTMMNIARLAVGVQSNGVADHAYQQAVWFANQRVQGTAINNPKGKRVNIIQHDDVKRMLMLQKCRIEAMRALGLLLAASLDKVLHHPEPRIRTFNQAMVDILTPIVKGYGTELGLENVSLALQVHGGMGFIEETGAAQFYRDQRITPIYEGTTGIQALDLINRKLLRDQGYAMNQIITFIKRETEQINSNQLGEMQRTLSQTLDTLCQTTKQILTMATDDIRKPAAICEPYLRLTGTILAGWQMLKAADISDRLAQQDNDPFYQNKITTARFYFDYEIPKVNYYKSLIHQSADSIVELDSSIFETIR